MAKVLQRATVFLKPCTKHQAKLSRGAPGCFHNFGGEFVVLREVMFETFLLEHGGGEGYGLAQEHEIEMWDQL